jgi:hypothetical protein
MVEIEIWKEALGYEGIYSISNFGRVKSFKSKKERILKPSLNGRGYLKVSLSNSNILYKTEKIHRLVAKAFIPNHGDKPQVNHKDGNKLNNNVKNLEWSTELENMTHACENKLVNNQGKNNGQSKLNDEEVREIKYGNKGMNHSEIARIYNISRTNVERIRTGKGWSHI